jgi:hypothetical protein
MGMDIEGWVEIKDPTWLGAPSWEGVIAIRYLIVQSYGMFESLFGVRVAHGLRPIAANRGLPPDASSRTKADIGMREDEVSAPSWLVAPSWVLWSEILAIDWTETGTAVFPPATVPETRLQQMTATRKMLFRIMRLLGKQFGVHNVRLVVWFDSL